MYPLWIGIRVHVNFSYTDNFWAIRQRWIGNILNWGNLVLKGAFEIQAIIKHCAFYDLIIIVKINWHRFWIYLIPIYISTPYKSCELKSGHAWCNTTECDVSFALELTLEFLMKLSIISHKMAIINFRNVKFGRSREAKSLFFVIKQNSIVNIALHYDFPRIQFNLWVIG